MVLLIRCLDDKSSIRCQFSILSMNLIILPCSTEKRLQIYIPFIYYQTLFEKKINFF